MTLLVTNIGTLAGLDTQLVERKCGSEMSHIETLSDAYLVVRDGRFDSWGAMSELADCHFDEVVDAKGGTVLPSFCDSHTHVVYAGSREGEFVDKINGLSYEEIARRGGGILNSADRLHLTSEEELYRQAMERINDVIAMGTGLIEIKSGYGLTVEDEVKMLRVVKRIKENSPIAVKSTFLGAHAVGRAYAGRQAEYVDMLCQEMIPAVAREGLAEFVDVFCDEGFFTVTETAKILSEAVKYGMRPKIHANELAISGGVEVGIEHGAISVDHLERVGDEQIEALRASHTMPTLLPGASHFLGIDFAPGRKMIDAGLGIALASDFNPGSSPSGSMQMVLSLASLKMKLQPVEALNAATINGAAAMAASDEYGSIGVGKVANFFITKPMSSIEYFAYAYTSPLIARVFLNGLEV